MPSHPTGEASFTPQGSPSHTVGQGGHRPGSGRRGAVVEISGLQLTLGTLGPGPTEAQGLGRPLQLSGPFLYTLPASKRKSGLSLVPKGYLQ